MALIQIESEAEFEDVLSRDGMVLMDFYGSWCGPCQMFHPILEEADQQFSDSLTIAQVDSDRFGDLSDQYGADSLPTLIFFYDKKPVLKARGYRDLASLKELLKIARKKAGLDVVE